MITNRAAANFKQRIARAEGLAVCTVPGCGKATMAAAGKGLADTLCKRHVGLKARHGSAWARTIKASDLQPHLAHAQRLIEFNKAHNAEEIAPTLHRLSAMLRGAGAVDSADHIKWKPAAERARVAFARLREAGVTAERVLAIHMAVSAFIGQSPSSPRDKEYRVVQVAKAVHRLASGTHRRYEMPGTGPQTVTRVVGGVRTTEHRPAVPAKSWTSHLYPRSSGRVLRFIGNELEEYCAELTCEYLELLRKRHGGPEAREG
jgi:hypothetical protein